MSKEKIQNEEMSDSEMWHIYNKMQQDKRHSNMKQSTAILDNAGIYYESKNGGVHLIVRHGLTVVDYWPSTGKWIPRGKKYNGKAGRGVFSLLKWLGIVWSPEEDRFQAG